MKLKFQSNIIFVTALTILPMVWLSFSDPIDTFILDILYTTDSIYYFGIGFVDFIRDASFYIILLLIPISIWIGSAIWSVKIEKHSQGIKRWVALILMAISIVFSIILLLGFLSALFCLATNYKTICGYNETIKY